MDSRLTDQSEEQLSETPEDVAILYSWANLHGAKYRDFSASRREYRAQVRHRAAEEVRQAELKAQAEAEAAATEAERIAREAERTARNSERFESPVERERALRDVEDAVRRASAERVEAARRAEAAAVAEATARREEREIAEAHASAERQAARWNDSELRRRHLAGPQPARPAAPSHNTLGDPYELTHFSSSPSDLTPPPAAAQSIAPQPRYRDEVPAAPRPRGFRPDQASGVLAAYRLPQAEPPPRSRTLNDFSRITPPPVYNPPPPPAAPPAPQRDDRAFQKTQSDVAPAWLYAGSTARPPAEITPLHPAPTVANPTTPATDASDTLQQSRERVASRWFALKGVFAAEPVGPTRVHSITEARTPVLAVFSLGGGVGKTSLVATLGRALSSLGEKVLLADTTSHGLLPYYFGATELKPGVVRTFSPPSGSADAPIHLVSYDVSELGGDTARQDALATEILRSGSAAQRLLVDFNVMSGWLMPKFTHLAQTVLVPLAPDMNSVISLQAVERYFTGALDEHGKPLLPFYVLNQFDAGLPLHLDVREVLRRQLGDRLLPCVIRRSPAVSEALAEGMTVVDYQPEGAISEDYLNVAGWLRSVSPAATQASRNTRWSER